MPQFVIDLNMDIMRFNIDHRVAVFSLKEAEFVLRHSYPGLTVWGIHNQRATVIPNMYEAQEFFSRENEIK